MSQVTVESGATIALFGFGVTGRAVASELIERNTSVLVFDDNPNDEMVSAAEAIGVNLVAPKSEEEFHRDIEDVDFAIPTPGLRENHFFFKAVADRGIPILTEFDLAAQWDKRPILAITGTNGKTTVSTMVHEMLERSGIVSALAGNTDIPLVSAIRKDETETMVVEASSFRLSHSNIFKPRVAAWLNFAPDHLDVHRNLDTYEQAKKVIWKNLGPADTAVAGIEDEVVHRNIPSDANTITFGLSNGDSRLEGEMLIINGIQLFEVRELPRRSPHDILNALAAGSIAAEGGATDQAIQEVLRAFSGLPHRLTFLGSKEGVRWFNDSKSTTPHSVAAAVQGFDNVILIAGGQNKGIDLSSLKLLEKHLKSVIAIGEASDEIYETLLEVIPVVKAETMEEAVGSAYSQSREGDSVILSPGCASFDWYRNYSDRGDHFTSLVNEIVMGEV